MMRESENLNLWSLQLAVLILKWKINSNSKILKKNLINNHKNHTSKLQCTKETILAILDKTLEVQATLLWREWMN